MQIEGPLDIKIIDNENSQGRELQLTFKADFQHQDHEQRVEAFRQHIVQLQKNIEQTDDTANQQGMLAILQVCEQLLPHLEEDEIPLEETIVIEIGTTSPFDHLLDSAKLT